MKIVPLLGSIERPSCVSWVLVIHLLRLSSAPTLLHDNDKEIGLLDFVKSADPFKVKVGERTLIENEVSLITETKDRVISPSLRTISLVDHTIQDELNVNSGKRMKRVAFVSGSPPGDQASDGCGSAAPTTEDVTSSSITPTLERVLEDALHDNVRTHPPFGCFVVLSSGSTDTDIPATSQTIDSATTLNVYVPNWRVTPPGYWAESSMFQLDAKVAELKAKLEKSESEAVEVEELRKRVSDLEAAVSVKVSEVASLTAQNAGLLEKVSALELERDGLKGQVVGESIQEGLEARVVHGRAGRSLTQIEAFDLEVEGKYVAAF
ncbi:hypothetical protein Tco_1463050 [Tanacetum coccineum]